MRKMERTRYEYIRRTVKLHDLETQVRESRLRSFGHKRQRDVYIESSVLRIELPGTRIKWSKWRRLERRFMDAVRTDMQSMVVNEEDTDDRS